MKSKDGKFVSNEDYAIVLDSYISKIEDNAKDGNSDITL